MKNNNTFILKPDKPKIVHVRCWYSPISKFSSIFKLHHYYNQWFTYLCWDRENKKYYWGTRYDPNMISWDSEIIALIFTKNIHHSSLYNINNIDFTYFNFDLNNLSKDSNNLNNEVGN